jgi:hypothetical protein
LRSLGQIQILPHEKWSSQKNQKQKIKNKKSNTKIQKSHQTHRSNFKVHFTNEHLIGH